MPRRKWQARERLSEMRAVADHDPTCTWPLGQPCIKFSTDGTRAGAEIAHTMGTTSEVIIAQGKAPNDKDSHPPFVSDVDAEQADWEGDEELVYPLAADTTYRLEYHHDACQGKGCEGCGWVGKAPLDHEYPRPYLASKCDFPED